MSYNTTLFVPLPSDSGLSTHTGNPERLPLISTASIHGWQWWVSQGHPFWAPKSNHSPSTDWKEQNLLPKKVCLKNSRESQNTSKAKGCLVANPEFSLIRATHQRPSNIWRVSLQLTDLTRLKNCLDCFHSKKALTYKYVCPLVVIHHKLADKLNFSEKRCLQSGRPGAPEPRHGWSCAALPGGESRSHHKQLPGSGEKVQELLASLQAQTVKNPPAVQENGVRSLGQEDPLEEGMATHSSILAWRIPMDRGAWRATVLGVSKSQTQLSDWDFPAPWGTGSWEPYFLLGTSSLLLPNRIEASHTEGCKRFSNHTLRGVQGRWDSL